MSVNKVILMGNVGSNPEIKTAANGLIIANIGLATSQKIKDNEQTDWHNVVAFGKLAEIVRDYVKKGDKIYVEGGIHYNSYQDKNGIKRTQANIVAGHIEMISTKSSMMSKGEQMAMAQGLADKLNENLPF